MQLSSSAQKSTFRFQKHCIIQFMIVFCCIAQKQQDVVHVYLDRFGRFWPMKIEGSFFFFLLKYPHLILVNQWGSDSAQRNFTTRGSKTTCNNSKQNVITPQHCGPNSIVHCYRVTQNLQILRSILFRIENKRNKEESERKILSSYWSGPSGFRTKMALEWR